MKKERKKEAQTPQANEGEGSRTAARRYNEGVRLTVHRGKFEDKARQAAKALEGPEGAELRRAEDAAKHSQKNGVSH